MEPEKQKTLRRFFPYIVPFKRIVLVNLLTVGTISILGIINPLLFRVMFNEVFPTRNIPLFFMIVISGIFIEIAYEVLAFVRDYIDLYVTQKVQHDLRRDVFEKFERQKIDYYSKLSTGEHLWRLTGDVTRIQEMVSTNIPRILQTSLEFILLLALAFWIDWKLSLLALTIIPVFVLNAYLSAKETKKFSNETQEDEAAVTGFIKENISGMEEVRLNNREKNELRKYLRKVGNKIRTEARERTFYFWNRLRDQISVKLWSALVTGLASYHLIVGELNFGDYMAVITYLLRLFGPLASFNHIYQQIVWQVASGERLLEFIDEPDLDKGTKNKGDLSLLGDIVFKNVSFKYKDYLEFAVRDIQLTIPNGQKVAIVGPIGCGKSTLIKLLLKLHEPSEGSITVNGHKLTEIHSKELRKKMGVVMQKPVIFNDTIMNNIKFGKKGATDTDVEDVLKLMNVHDYFMEFDQGLKRMAGEEGANLSGGQKQLVAIARAYIKNPEILILDEATSALDTFMEMKINAAMRKLMEGRTTIMIAHRLSSIRNVDRILYMRDGSVVEDGPLEELLSKKGYYYQIYSQYYDSHDQLSLKKGEQSAPVAAVSSEGFVRLWDLQKKESKRYFQGKVNITQLYTQEGEVEIDLTGKVGYCSDVCIADLPVKYSESALKQIAFDLYIPEKSLTAVKNYLLLHLVSVSSTAFWYEIDKRKLEVGWNYLVFKTNEKDLHSVTHIKRLFFVFNSDNAVAGPVYLSNVKAEFEE